jgi:hypothetical protein
MWNKHSTRYKFLKTILQQFLFFSSAFCGINCSPGYCFSNPASQPPYACYCTDNTIQLNSCFWRNKRNSLCWWCGVMHYLIENSSFLHVMTLSRRHRISCSSNKYRHFPSSFPPHLIFYCNNYPDRKTDRQGRVSIIIVVEREKRQTTFFFLNVKLCFHPEKTVNVFSYRYKQYSNI